MKFIKYIRKILKKEKKKFNRKQKIKVQFPLLICSVKKKIHFLIKKIKQRTLIYKCGNRMGGTLQLVNLEIESQS